MLTEGLFFTFPIPASLPFDSPISRNYISAIKAWEDGELEAVCSELSYSGFIEFAPVTLKTICINIFICADSIN